MRAEEELIAVAQQLKAKLIRRSANLERMISRKAKSQAGMINRLNSEVYETLEHDIKHLNELNIRDTVIYATLRWALGITEDIDYDKLQLVD